MDVIDEKSLRSTSEYETEIRLIDIAQFAKDNFRKMLLGGVIGLILGMLYAIPKPNIFKVEVTVMPEYQNKGAGGFGSVSAFAGLGLDNTNTSDAIRPDLYPNVLQSVPFALNMLSQQVYSEKLGATMPLQEFINKTSTVSLLDKLIGIFTANDNTKVKLGPKNRTQAIQITNEQNGLVNTVKGSVGSVYDRKTGIFTITTTGIDPIVTATLAQLSLNYLTNYITAYRTDKARKRVIFLMRQVNEAKQRYQSTEYSLSNYRDRNRSLYLNTAKLDEQRLQAEYLLAQEVYNDLAKQLEQAKIKIEEDTPTFKTLQPPIVPLVKSGPKRTLIIIGFAIAGVIVVICIGLIRRIIVRQQLR